MKSNITWTTNDEIEFIKRLGDFSGITTSRGILLEKYQRAFENRKRLDGLNRRKILNYLQGGSYED